MANMLMMHYAATKGDEREMRNGNMSMPDYGRRESRERDMGMPYRNEYDGGAESRYRGRDGRWKAGTRRSEYQERPGMTYDSRNEPMRSEDDEEEGRKYKIEVLPQNVVEWPYGQPEDSGGDYRFNRQIGFGAQNHMGNERMNDQHMMGRSSYDEEPMEFNREVAEHWVRGMKNEDKAHPIGGKWTPEMLKPMAKKYNVPTEGKEFWEFYAMTNAMYSNFSEVAKKFGVTSPEFFVCMAKAWMDDKDAEPDNTALYYEYIVKK